MVRLVPAALSRGTSSSPLTRRVGVSCLSLTPPSGSLREPSPRRSWTVTSLAGCFLQLETGQESPRLYFQQTLCDNTFPPPSSQMGCSKGFDCSMSVIHICVPADHMQKTNGHSLSFGLRLTPEQVQGSGHQPSKDSKRQLSEPKSMTARSGPKNCCLAVIWQRKELV